MSTRYTHQQITEMAEKLRALPAIEKPTKQDLSKQETVKVLTKEIVALQKRGYSLVQISESLRGIGLPVATPTLKSYLQRAKPQNSAAKKSASADTSATSAPRTEESSAKSSFQPKPDTLNI